MSKHEDIQWSLAMAQFALAGQTLRNLVHLAPSSTSYELVVLELAEATKDLLCGVETLSKSRHRVDRERAQ